ncbi:hypothetical protein SJI19_06080 [Acerihabitans sp. TG2]|uniref:hypothetical protein n=1 Tax=Acerihabitans sp. TG2 TaxID=3096008 RepID=UPI002B234A00|nr:hypothetical protein [Acerihabitans sp. TG2]MEA9390121.1 hypothetical protein [Acerihabitans sp. TG2]
MTDTTNLTIKIPLELKDKIRAAAQETQVSLSAEVCARLEKSFEISTMNLEHAASLIDNQNQVASLIDNQNTEEHAVEEPLSHKELKKIRQLLQDSHDRLKKSAKKK